VPHPPSRSSLEGSADHLGWSRKTGAVFRHGKVQLRGKASAPPESGDHSFTVRLPVNGEVRKPMPLEVKLRSLPPVRLAEAEVFFGMVPKDEKAEKRMQLWVYEGVSVEAVEVEDKPEWLEMELIEPEGDETSAVRFVLLPVEETGPFSGQVKLGLVTGAGRHEAAVRCYGIRSQ
jgi:hypothetical protein